MKSLPTSDSNHEQIVSGPMMIEPTETEARPELDAFIHAMRRIVREAEENREIVLQPLTRRPSSASIDS